MDDETYEISEKEVLILKLSQAEIEKAAVTLQLLRERYATVQRELAGKYSEYGKYELVGELDLESRKGCRRKVEPEVQPWKDPRAASAVVATIPEE